MLQGTAQVTACFTCPVLKAQVANPNIITEDGTGGEHLHAG